MAPRPPSATEEAAAQIVAAYLQATPKWRDTGQTNRTHDWDIVGSSGVIVALEVTCSTNGDFKALWDAVAKHTWEAPELDRFWTLFVETPVHPAPSVRNLVGAARELLKILEVAGVDSVGMTLEARSHDPAVRVALGTLRRLGVQLAASVTAHGKVPMIGIATGGGDTPADDGALNAEVEKRVAQNLEKLAGTDATERHLFVWLDWSSPDAYALMRRPIPEAPPYLQPPVDAVWIAPYAIYGNPPDEVPWLWRASSAGWERLRPSPAKLPGLEAAATGS